MARLTQVAAWGSCAAAIGYGVPQLMQVAGMLPDPLDRILIFAPSLALAPLFVAMLGGVAADADRWQRSWRFAALGFGILYAAFVMPVYAIQLGVVIPRELAGAERATWFACCGFRQPLTVVDLTGYTMMSLATLLLAPTYRGFTSLALLLNGVLAVPLFLQLWWPWLIWVGALWLITFPLATALVALDPARGGRG
ncbi:hypothetical protein ACFQ1E_08385 [Sphingomonas canadensis]|uniref:Uncharacterized protein n=1 Tax=Sphingomonas canadensis TaxID=1219257 RepID=A0ABW3H4B7_9SPHN|nr:hypothetical protein [Sphingomonas canadensis]MCW3836055.1 hypothetical protein [Sphingomonas canadensis]